jgi:hypothetical protein
VRPLSVRRGARPALGRTVLADVILCRTGNVVVDNQIMARAGRSRDRVRRHRMLDLPRHQCRIPAQCMRCAANYARTVRQRNCRCRRGSRSGQCGSDGACQDKRCEESRARWNRGSALEKHEVKPLCWIPNRVCCTRLAAHQDACHGSNRSMCGTDTMHTQSARIVTPGASPPTDTNAARPQTAG